MPYTPPTRSPASSNANSPVLSRNHSYEGPIVPPNNRPGLPRSRSAAYIHKHRRAPSISDQPEEPTAADHSIQHHGSRIGTTNGIYAGVQAIDQLTGEVANFSPAGSSLTSEDEDDRGRGKQIEALANSLKGIVLVNKRPASPPRQEEEGGSPAAPKSTPALLAVDSKGALRLTAEARKIAHSRSSSEIQLSKLADVPSTAASSDSEDDSLNIKPPLLRKKSGELVKPALRPPSRRRPSSMPGTPTFNKAVHFNEDIEQVRHFLQVDRPMAVSAGSSPVETYDSETEYPFNGRKVTPTEWEIKLSNEPKETFERSTQPVRVERIFLAADQKMLVGVVACANISFHKHVVARFTFDYWKTTSEVTAEYNHDVRKKEANDGYDRFNFNIKLSDQARLENKTLFICVRYNVSGQEFWDNNNNMNYQVDFVKKVAPRNVKPAGGAGTLGSIPRSRHTPPNAQPRPRSFPSSNEEDFNASFEFGAGTLPLKDRSRKGSLYPTQQKRGAQQQAGGAFGTRYDFGASLSAALTRAQSQIGQGSLNRSKSSDYFGKTAKVQPSTIQPRTSAPAVQPPEATPAKISSDRPELGSQEYHDLIQKFCYFGSKTGSPGANSPDAAPQKPDADATASPNNEEEDEEPVSSSVAESDESAPNSASSSASNSPPTERLERANPLDGASDSSSSHRTSRSVTPSFHSSASPRLIAQYRSPSPALNHEMVQVLAQ